MGKGKRKRLDRAVKERSLQQGSSVKNNMPENIIKDRLFGLRLDLIICVFLALVTLIVYWRMMNHEFINFDDDTYVTNNRHVRAGLNSESISWSFSFREKEKTYWHPLTWLSHMLDCHLYGLDPGMHHLTNLMFHISNCVLLFLVFNRMTGTIWKSAFVAALFALHPINVDSVAWVAERKNLLSTFFWMLTMLSYSYYCERPRAYRYLLTLLAFALGLLAKPMLVTLPFVLLLFDYWPLERIQHFSVPSVFRLFIEKIPFFVVSAFSIYLSVTSIDSPGNVITLKQVPMDLRVLNALVAYLSYIGKMVWPQNLAVHYPFPVTIPFWKAACSGMFLVLVSGAVILMAKRRSYLFVGWFWFFGTLVPAIGLVQAGLFPAMADRWAYVPLIGLFIIIAWGTSDLLGRWKHKKTGLALTGTTVLSILVVTTLLQLRHWRNHITLCEHALRVTTNNDVIHSDLGIALERQGRHAEAISHLSAALRINPYYALAHSNLGFVFLKQGKLTEAKSHLSAALRIDPNHAYAHNNLGLVFVKQGKVPEAVSHFSAAIRINPGIAEAHNNLGLIAGKQGKLLEAISHFSEALRVNPYYDNAHTNLGVALVKQGNLVEANRRFSEALRINPENAKARSYLQAVSVTQNENPKWVRPHSEKSRGNLDSAKEHDH